MSTIRVDRLRQLADRVERAGTEEVPTRLNMAVWFVADPASHHAGISPKWELRDVIADALSADRPACGSAACMAGHACLEWPAEAWKHLHNANSVSEAAARILGIEPDLASNLFLAYWRNFGSKNFYGFDNITPAEAAGVLRNLADQVESGTLVEPS